MTHRPNKIISGGQTGADMGGLMAAKSVGIATGGCAPRGYKTEVGAQPELLQAFGLVEHVSDEYRLRTRENVINSDATLILASDPESDGTKLTIRYCEELGKPCLLVAPNHASIAKIQKFLDGAKPGILNIAGNRESKSKGITAATKTIIEAVFQSR